MTLTVFGRKFAVGQLVVTPDAYDLPQDEVWYSLVRHMDGDWGTLCRFDREQNDLALKNGGRLISRYATMAGREFWIITESDRSVTTILLPSDY